MVKTGRPTITGTGRVVSMNKHTPVTFAKKRAALRCLEATGCMQTVRARFFSDLTNDAWDTKRKQIYAWRKTKATIDALGSCATTASKLRVRRLGIGTTLDQDIELELVRWAIDLRRDGVPVSRLLLVTKAQELAADAGLEKDQFIGSHTWTMSFVKRHKLSFRARTRTGNATEADGEAAAAAFGRLVLDTVRTQGLYTLFYTLLYTRVLLFGVF